MPALEKATLLEIKADGSAAPILGTEIDVQFNPQSLKLSLSNKIEGGVLGMNKACENGQACDGCGNLKKRTQ